MGAAFVADWATYLVFTAVPLRAIALGADALVLGLLPAMFATIYVVAALGFGRLSDRGGRIQMARLGAAVMTIGALLLLLAKEIEMIFLLLPVFSIGRGLFWPAFQAELGERCLAVDLRRRTGWFNVAWSSGKMMGFWTAGHLTESYGTGSPLLLAALFGLIVGWIVPSARRPAVEAMESASEESVSGFVRRRFRQSAWAANFIAFGVAATLNYQFPKLFLSLGYREGDLGDFLGLVMLAQTVTFAWLGLRRGWEYRLSWMTLPMLVGAIAVAALTWLRSEIAILGCAPALGFFFAVAYSESLYHSLHRESGRGRNAGIHEALLGCGSFLLPLLGGWAAGEWGLGAPYLLCASVTALTACLLALRLRRGTPDRPIAPVGGAGEPYGDPSPDSSSQLKG